MADARTWTEPVTWYMWYSEEHENWVVMYDPFSIVGTGVNQDAAMLSAVQTLKVHLDALASLIEEYGEDAVGILCPLTEEEIAKSTDSCTRHVQMPIAVANAYEKALIRGLKRKEK